jgi:DNA uptake protein ComE-like DNA-binding protein
MARRHWLDPLARRVLIATGHIPAPSALAARRAAHEDAARQAAHDAAVERDFWTLKGACAAGLVDVNRATASDWRQLPGCTAEQADLLVRLQAGGVQLSGPDDLRRLLNLDGATLREWLPRLVFHWYGEPAPLPVEPVAINKAGAAELRERLSLSPERLGRLQQERARAPFRDLADLQERLQLPAPLVEAWIGRLSIDPPHPAPGPSSPARSEATPRGPSLPPTRRRSSPTPRQGRTP